MRYKLEPAIWSCDTGQRICSFDRCPTSKKYTVNQGCMSFLDYGRHVGQLRRRRAYAPTSNTASHDNHEKINSWVSFTFARCLWGSAWRPGRRSSAIILYFQFSSCFTVWVMSSCHFCWLRLGDSLFPDTNFLYTSLLGFLLFEMKWFCLKWNDSEMIPRKDKGRAVRSCIVWKAARERETFRNHPLNVLLLFFLWWTNL